MSQPRSQGRTSAARVAGAYLVAGILWILLSDRILAALVTDPSTLSLLQTLKGWLFVAASAGFIAWLVGRELRRVARTQSRFEALAGQGIVGTFAIRKGRFIHANQKLCEIFGYGEDELLGLRVLDLVTEDDRPAMRAPGGGDGTGVVRRRFTGLRRDGTQLQAEVHGRTTDWDGEPAMAGILVDISDHVRLHDRLRQAGRLEALGEVTGAVAHDFNNFLTGILGNLDLVMFDIEEDPAAAEESLRLVRDAASRAANLTGQLLSFSRGRAFDHRPIDPNEHLRKLADFLRSLAGKGQTLTLELADGVPPILLDPVALDQLVVNLFVNAKQAIGDRGTIIIRTRSRISSAGADVFIEVEDDGMGMPSDVLDRIFEPFFTTKERGTGLGLATVRSIMDEAQGNLTVQSVPEVGTTVRLIFPQAAHILIQDQPEARLVGGQGQVHTATVLIVDGDAAVGRVMAVALQRHGYRTVETRTCAECIQRLADGNDSVDLVILDGDLEKSGPGEMLGKIRQARPAMPVLVTTGTRGVPGPEDLEAESPVLPKPFSVEVLLAAVEDALTPDVRGRKREINGA